MDIHDVETSKESQNKLVSTRIDNHMNVWYYIDYTPAWTIFSYFSLSIHQWTKPRLVVYYDMNNIPDLATRMGYYYYIYSIAMSNSVYSCSWDIMS